MSSSPGDWDLALGLVAEALGVADAAPHVIRVEVRPDGDQLWTTERPGPAGGAAWFRYRDQSLVALDPAADEALPGAEEHLRGNVLAWRPGRRAVTLSPDGSSVWKLFRKKRFEAAVRKHRIAGTCDPRDGGWRIPAILLEDQQAAMVHFERIHGDGIALDATDTAAWTAVGKGLRRFQDTVSIESLSRHDRRDEIDGVQRLHSRFARAVGQRMKAVDALVGRLDPLVECAPSEGPVAAHGDLHDGQLLTDEAGLWVLDFDGLCAAEPELDLGNLTAHMVLRDLQRGGGESDECASRTSLAALGGYQIQSTEHAHDALRFYQAATFARLAILYSLRPRWRALADPLLRHADASLNEATSV